MIFLTSSFSSSHPKTKLFPRTQAIDSWYFSHTSLRWDITSLHLLSTFRFLVVDPKLGLFFVFSIELHEDDMAIVTVSRNSKGIPDRKRMSHLSLFSCLSEDRKFASEDFLTPTQGSQFLPFSQPVLYRAVHSMFGTAMFHHQRGSPSRRGPPSPTPLS